MVQTRAVEAYPESEDCWSTEELKRRGWTPQLIKRFLVRYDFSRRNANASATRLYLCDRVEVAEKRRAFIKARDRAGRDLENAKAAASELAAVRIVVEPLDFDELCERALADWRKTRPDAGPVGWATTVRIVVHFARLERVAYANLEPVESKIGRNTALKCLKWRVLKAVADEWPALTDEAERQAFEAYPDGPPNWLRGE